MRRTLGWYAGVFLIMALLAQGVLGACSASASASGVDAPSIGIAHIVDAEHSDSHNQLDVPTLVHEPHICDAADVTCASLVGASSYLSNHHVLVDAQGAVEVEHRHPISVDFTLLSQAVTSSSSMRRALLQVFLN